MPALSSSGRFLVRLLVAYALSVIAVGAAQLWHAERAARAHALRDAVDRHDADVRFIERAYLAQGGNLDVAEMVAAIASRPEVRYVALVDAHRRTAVGRRPARPLAQDREVIRALFAGRPTARAVPDGGGFRFVLPVRADTGRFALEVGTNGARLERRLAQLERASLVLVLLGLLISPPVFYLVGGHALARRHRHALERSRRDGLTGLGNHVAFQEELRRAVEHARRHAQPLALALIDLDDFKLANDRHGHRHGDRLLREAGAVLGATRAGDLPFRIGGDEFALLMPSTNAAGAAELSERIRATVARRGWGVTVSAGVAVLYGRVDDADSLSDAADAALYEAKRRGRDRVVGAHELGDVLAGRVTSQQAHALHALLDGGEIGVAFQPIVDLRRDAVLGYEALARPMSDALAGPARAFEVAHGSSASPSSTPAASRPSSPGPASCPRGRGCSSTSTPPPSATTRSTRSS